MFNPFNFLSFYSRKNKVKGELEALSPSEDESTQAIIDKDKNKKRKRVLAGILLLLLLLLGIICNRHRSVPNNNTPPPKAVVKQAPLDSKPTTIEGQKVIHQPGNKSEPAKTNEHIKNNAIAPKLDNKSLEGNMVFVEGGIFIMGSNDVFLDQKPAHSVTISSFSIGKYEVTQAQWKAIMGYNPSGHENCDDCPVENVSWNDTQEYLQKLNKLTGKNYRLPTEAEWEFAASGGNKTNHYIYSGSNTLSDVAWNGVSETYPVGKKRPNELGIYDMSGNVREWCEDQYHANYIGAPNTGDAWVDNKNSSFRIGRGGGWSSVVKFCRVSFRNYGKPDDRVNLLGFRLALSQ